MPLNNKQLETLKVLAYLLSLFMQLRLNDRQKPEYCLFKAEN